MGPGNETVSSSTALKLVQKLPTLQEGSANWSDYKSRIVNHAVSKGLKRHLFGTARKPEKLVLQQDGKWYKEGSLLLPVEEAAVEKNEDAWDEYDQKEAQTREFIYQTIPKSLFIRVRDLPTACDVWKKLIDVNENRGSLIAADLLTKLQNMRLSEGGNLRNHITEMKELREKLAEMGHPVDDLMFTSNITRSLSSSAMYKPVLTSISIIARNSSQPVDIEVLLSSLESEYDQSLMQAEEKKSQEALVASFNKARGSDRNRKGNRSGKSGKGGGSGNPHKDTTCHNCNKKGHIKTDCYAEGGGKADSAPAWFKALPKEKQKVAKGANVAEKEEKSDGVALLATSSVDYAASEHRIMSDF